MYRLNYKKALKQMKKTTKFILILYFCVLILCVSLGIFTFIGAAFTNEWYLYIFAIILITGSYIYAIRIFYIINTNFINMEKEKLLIENSILTVNHQGDYILEWKSKEVKISAAIECKNHNFSDASFDIFISGHIVHIGINIKNGLIQEKMLGDFDFIPIAKKYVEICLEDFIKKYEPALWDDLK